MTAGRLTGLAIVAILLSGGCGGPGNPARPGPPSTGAPPASPVEGIVVELDSSGLNAVTTFRLRTVDGTLLDFEIGDLEDPTTFPPAHLAEHQAAALPVRVFFRVEAGDPPRLVVHRIEDAG